MFWLLICTPTLLSTKQRTRSSNTNVSQSYWNWSWFVNKQCPGDILLKYNIACFLIYYTKFEEAKIYLEEVRENFNCESVNFAHIYCDEAINEDDNLEKYLEKIDKGTDYVKYYLKAAFLLYKHENFELCAKIVNEALSKFGKMNLSHQLDLLNLSQLLEEELDEFKKSPKLVFFKQNFEKMLTDGIRIDIVEFYLFNKAIDIVNEEDMDKHEEGVKIFKEIYDFSNLKNLAFLSGINLINYFDRTGNVESCIEWLKKVISRFEELIDVSCFVDKLEDLVILHNVKPKDKRQGGSNLKKSGRNSHKEDAQMEFKEKFRSNIELVDTKSLNNFDLSMESSRSILPSEDLKSMKESNINITVHYDKLLTTDNHQNLYRQKTNWFDSDQLIKTTDFDLLDEMLAFPKSQQNMAIDKPVPEEKDKFIKQLLEFKQHHIQSNNRLIDREVVDENYVYVLTDRFLNNVYFEALNFVNDDTLAPKKKFRQRITLYEKNDEDYTKEELEGLLEIDPDNEILNFRLGYKYLEENNFTKFKDYLLCAFKKNPKYETNLITYTLGLMYLRNKDYDTALFFFSKNYKKCPENAYNALLLIGKIFERTNQNEKAIITYQKFNKNYLNQKIGDYKIAKIKFKQNDLIAAEDGFFGILKENPLNIKVMIYLGIIRLKTTTLFTQKARKDILSYFNKAMASRELSPKFECMVRENLSIFYEKIGNIDLAIKNLEFSIKLRPNNQSYLYRLINLLIRGKRYKEAIKVYKIIIKRNPHNFSLSVKLGILYAFIGDYKKAIKLLIFVSSKDRNNFTANFIIGKIYRDKLKLPKVAIQYFSKIENGENLYKVNYEIGVTYIQLGNENKGIDYLQKALKERKE